MRSRKKSIKAEGYGIKLTVYGKEVVALLVLLLSIIGFYWFSGQNATGDQSPAIGSMSGGASISYMNSKQ